MESASCGPSNAVKNLNNFTNQNKLYNNINQNQNHHLHQQQNLGFKSSNPQIVDHSLNNEFSQFNRVNQQQQTPSHFQQQSFNQPQPHSQHLQQNKGGAWINDFSNLSIEQQHAQNQAQSIGLKNDWHQQFMQNQQQQQQQRQNHILQQKNHEPQQFRQQFTPAYINSGLQYRSQMSTPQFSQQSEHQQVHKIESSDAQFKDQFDMIEKELNETQQQFNEQMTSDIEKEEFAESARKVESSMKSINSQDSTMNDKFANSKFLKLMSSIGDKQVELEGDKLVNSKTKNDLRGENELENIQISKTPTTSNTTNPDYHKPMHNEIHTHTSNHNWNGETLSNQPSEQEEIVDHPQNKLPDPLAHIKDGDLNDINDPLTAARLISGGQVKPRNWEEDDDWLVNDTPQLNRPFRKGQIVDHQWDEMYTDYRHDDDFH
ncbi:unnamed protein product [Candida verbasci]|uniref:Uncharacterized protein n=1 Tax=Candida verbasci TaxID=1227364 RepID=A0A9W4U0G6_9ASCO|nr:unnamed protein product [Candida verbasci]